MNCKTVSIIMPVYNAEQYVRDAIQSVLEQAYTNWELILVNDGSTDNSLKICLEYQLIDKRIRVIDLPHGGVSCARNAGLKAATNTGYVSFLDSDDTWERTFLEELMAVVLNDKTIDFIYSGADELDESGNIVNTHENYKAGKLDSFMHKSGEFRPPFNMDSFIVKKELLNKYGIIFPGEYEISEDICFFLKLLCVTSAYYVPKRLTHYRHHQNSATTSLWSAKRWESTVLIFYNAERFCEKYAPEFKNDFEIMRTFRAYRFVLSVLKNGTIKETIYYINKFKKDLILFVKIGKK